MSVFHSLISNLHAISNAYVFMLGSYMASLEMKVAYRIYILARCFCPSLT